MKSATVRYFAPDQWGQVDFFSKFYSKTFDLDAGARKALSGVGNHFQKAALFLRLATRLLPNLEEDRKELERNGHTPAINARELSAVIEGVILELYSSIDCTRRLLRCIYKKEGFPNSTRGVFQKAVEDKLDERIPETIRGILKNAKWYHGFRIIRDELTHSDVGRCHLDRESGNVSYLHTGLQPGGKPLVVDNIFEKLDQSFEDVNRFLAEIYAYLNSCLIDEEMTQICGFFGGRVYDRSVSPIRAVDFNSGQCLSFEWFEKDENPACPFVDSCGAYANRVITSEM